MLDIIPAVDLKGGRCVRLRQGKAEAETVYADDPVAVAQHWQAVGARRLHVVDLDGAFAGSPVHTGMIAAIARALRIPVQAGGGLRTRAHVHSLLEAGVERAVVGTRAASDPEPLAAWVRAFGARLAVAVDARDGRVRVRGWVADADMTALELSRRVDALGVATIIYTDTAQDGMLQGPNVKAVGEICAAVRCNVIASGGVAGPGDVRKLGEIDADNLRGVIVGKALYDGQTQLAELAAAADAGARRSET